MTTRALLKNWLIISISNFIGAAGLAVLVFNSGHPEMNDGAIGEQYLRIATAKCSLPFWSALLRGVLCSILVCMAVWMTPAERSVIDKVVAIVFPLSAFVAAGFEHSVADIYFIPMGILVKVSGRVVVTADVVT